MFEHEQIPGMMLIDNPMPFSPDVRECYVTFKESVGRCLDRLALARLFCLISVAAFAFHPASFPSRAHLCVGL